MKYPWLMQRCDLHFRGVKLPKLGSLRDRVFREAVQQERLLEAKKTEFLLMIATTNPTFTEDNQFREWSKSVKKVWKGYVGLLMNVDLPENTEEEVKMLDYYQNVVKNMKPKATKTESGTVAVSGLDALKM